jgi:hypothetical protein
MTETQTEHQTKFLSPALASQMFMPTNYNDAMIFCEKCAKEDFIPVAMKNKPMTLFLAWQMGASVGLDFFASIQNIAVINGKPCIYGDAALAIIMNHPHYEYHREWYEGSVEKGDMIYYCAIKRKGAPEENVKSFSILQAKRAKLWEKAGPWISYPERMLQMRARGFCMRDAIPGALKGLAIREEVIDLPPEDYHVIETKEPPKLGVDAVRNVISNSIELTKEDLEKIQNGINPETGEITEPEPSAAPSFDEVKKQMEAAQTVDDLIIASDVARAISKTKEQHDELAKIYKRKQTEVKA